jgi:hypothetical protein
MAVMSSVKLAAQIKSIKSNTAKLREAIQEALISCAYYAAKDGDPASFNRLLDAVGNSTYIKGLTMWAEIYGFVLVKNEKFVLNKKARSEAHVTDEASFAEFESEMRAGPKWYELVAKQKPESIFDPNKYLDGVIAKLEKEGLSEAAADIRTVAIKLAERSALSALRQEDEATAE